jgi:hypothetical protein
MNEAAHEASTGQARICSIGLRGGQLAGGRWVMGRLSHSLGARCHCSHACGWMLTLLKPALRQHLLAQGIRNGRNATSLQPVSLQDHTMANARTTVLRMVTLAGAVVVLIALAVNLLPADWLMRQLAAAIALSS